MQITFLLSGPAGNTPVGGYKVIYEYANRLSSDGFDVAIVYPLYMKPPGSGFKLFLKQLFVTFYAIKDYFNYKNHVKNSWFPLHENIKELLVWDLKEKNVPKSDAFVATYYTTAKYLKEYKSNSERFFFIQGFENFHVSDEKLLETWKFNLTKIVISKWLKEICESIGEPAFLVPNGFDFNYFQIEKPIETREKLKISMMYNPSVWKGFKEAFEAILIVKKMFPKLELLVFGAYEKPSEWPDWVRYSQSPDQKEHNFIYNESSIFVAASRSEGWGLTLGEAMICGNAIICTDIGGFSTMAIHEETALVSKVDAINQMAQNIIKLIENDDLRITIAKNGKEFIKQFTWEESYLKLKQILNKQI